MKLSKAIELYLAEVKATKEPSTYRSYEGRLKRLKAKHGGKEIKKVTAKKIGKWIQEESIFQKGAKAGQEKAANTIRLTIVAWEQLQNLMLEKKIIRKPIYEHGKKPGGRKRTRIPTKMEQYRVFREAIKKRRREFALIFRCLRLCGARPGELTKANIKDYDREQSLIILKHHKTAKKTQQDRQIGVGTTMRRLIDRAIGDRTEGPIFLDEKGRRWTPGKVSRNYRVIRDRLGLCDEYVLYCTRHEHGTILCETIGIHAAQHSLGHKDIQTTQRYVHPSPAKLPGYQDLI